jgi:DNA invertase Pin-like site-specific DNA recombinase
MLHLFAALAEKERRLISERTKAALEAKRIAGAKLGNTVSLVEAGLAGRAAQAQAANDFAVTLAPVLTAIRRGGASTLAEIADALNSRGVRTSAGGRWHRSSVRNLLARVQSWQA